MVELDACRFSTVTFRLLMMCWNPFWYAPRLDRSVDTVVIALAIVAMAALALLTRSMVSVPSALALTAPIWIVWVWPAWAPIWNTPPPEPCAEVVPLRLTALLLPSVRPVVPEVENVLPAPTADELRVTFQTPLPSSVTLACTAPAEMPLAVRVASIPFCNAVCNELAVL